LPKNTLSKGDDRKIAVVMAKLIEDALGDLAHVRRAAIRKSDIKSIDHAV
jgi:hypothetical protein